MLMRMRFSRFFLFVVAWCTPAKQYAQPTVWRLAPSPTVRVGAAEGRELSLAAPAGATRLPNGNIAVGDLAEYAIREFTPSGAVVKRFAHKGQGPGQVGFLAPLLRCGSVLVANDISGRSLCFNSMAPSSVHPASTPRRIDWLATPVCSSP